MQESVKANLRRLVKRLLRKYGYPPEKQEKAMVTVLQQAELLCRDWTVTSAPTAPFSFMFVVIN
ncbi:DUF3387 domain-containing protein [Nostoc sp. UCD121]|uniref:type I restriction enzyme endonuclease domain-containing protein n=1 Tax=Nostoc sp. UCD121 TaxID=2681305 RepID=UPI0016263877|nr:type I restriction enzyme endonuclease domain-containing protein [Nostoc sp. UCD121]MBC1281348.1 DUF3387 domain-containing protein [Nostoc sp. UCD121]